MRRKTHFYLLICFVLLMSTDSFAAQSEIIAQFRLPHETVRLMDKKSWNKLYERVVENLPREKFAPGRILFKLKGAPGVFLWTFNPGLDMAQMLAYVKSLLDVEYCQPDYIYTLEPYNIMPLNEVLDTNRNASTNEPNPIKPNDPWYRRQAHLGFLGMDKLFETYGPSLEKLTPRGHDPYIHIVDSGGGCEHPDLNRANIILKKDYVDGDDDPCSSPNSMDSHGEFVAAIACAVSNNNHGGAGICPQNTKLVIWRVLNKDGAGSSSVVGLALSQIIEESNGLGNEIINMSFAGPRKDFFLGLLIANGMARAEEGGKNIIFIAGSGNDGQKTLLYPAAFPDVLSAGASEFPLIDTGEISRANYSTHGKVDLVAPVGVSNQDNDQNGTADAIFVEGRVYNKTGQNPTSYGAYLFEGTSGATPIVSGVAASLINMGVYGPAAIRKALTETAGDVPPIGYDEETGWGMVRADVAVMSADSTLPVFSAFSQNSYVCTAAPGKNTCDISVNYSFRTNGYKIYLWDSYGNDALRELRNSDSGGNVTLTAPLRGKTWVMLIYYPDRDHESNDSWGEPRVFASTVVTAKISPPPTGSLSSDGCAPAFNSNSCTATVTHNIINNGWNVYFWNSNSGQSVPVSGSGSINVTVKSGVTTYVRSYYFIVDVDNDWNTKTDISGPGTGLDLNTR